jgi:hypothetical protein
MVETKEAVMSGKRSSVASHRSHPWRVHSLAADFEVLDVWRIDLRGGAGDFPRLVGVFWAEMQAAEGSALARLRLWMGRIFGWDRAPMSLPIPGCTEKSLVDRLERADHARDLTRPEERRPFESAGVQTVHLGRVEAEEAELAVYVKSRGLFTRLYMAAIKPFRYLVVYPRLLAGIERRWRHA